MVKSYCYHTMPHFDALQIHVYSCGKHCEKRRNCVSKAISPFSQCFLPSMALTFHFKCTLKMSSSVCFNLDQSKILSSGNGLILYHMILTFYDLEKAFENNVGNGENAGYQHFLHFPQCFLSFPKQISVFRLH